MLSEIIVRLTFVLKVLLFHPTEFPEVRDIGTLLSPGFETSCGVIPEFEFNSPSVDVFLKIIIFIFQFKINSFQFYFYVRKWNQMKECAIKRLKMCWSIPPIIPSLYVILSVLPRKWFGHVIADHFSIQVLDKLSQETFGILYFKIITAGDNKHPDCGLHQYSCLGRVYGKIEAWMLLTTWQRT